MEDIGLGGLVNKIAICFFGQVKNYTSNLYENFVQNITSQIVNYELDYYIVTYNNNYMFNPINGENHSIDYNSIFQYINFNSSLILDINSDEIKFVDNFSEYLVEKFGGCWGDNSQLSTKYAVRQLYGLKKLYTIISNKYYRYILLRPDIWYTSKLHNILINNNEDLVIPLFDSWGGYNDRFAIANNFGLKIYCNRYDSLIEKPVKYHSENYLKTICNYNNIKIKQLDNFYFKRVRANGKLQ